MIGTYYYFAFPGSATPAALLPHAARMTCARIAQNGADEGGFDMPCA